MSAQNEASADRISVGGPRHPRALRPAVAGIAVLAACLTVGACGTQTIVRTVTTNGSYPAASASTAAPASESESSGQTEQARVGDMLSVSGQDGERLDVTVDQVMDPLTVGPDDQADAGQRYVGVQITMKNSGSVPYSDSPSNGATLLSSSGEQATGEIVSGGPCGNDFQSSVKIAPGDSEQGCIPFELPDGQTAGTFQFTPDSGFANQTAQWSLKGGDARGSSSTDDAEATPGTTPAQATAAPADSTPDATTAGATGAGSASGCADGPCELSELPNQCSNGLASSETISCDLASNVFYEYYEATQTGAASSSISAWSSVTGKYYVADCSAGGGLVDCPIEGAIGADPTVEMTQAALAAYSPSQAAAYASNTDLGPNG
jgi:hypothetical protein